MKRIIIIAAVTIAAIIGFTFFTSMGGHDSHDAHDGHNHEEEEVDFDNISLTQHQVNTIDLGMGTVEQRHLDAMLYASGTLTLRAQSKAAVSSLMGGVVKSINVKEGQEVKKGTVVAYIENTDIVALQREYYSAVKTREAALREMQRQQSLQQNGAGVKKALQQAQTDLADREAKLIILQTDLNNKEMALQAANEVLENQQAAMAAQAEQIDALIGIRPRIITALSSALSSANLSATVDSSTGDIVLDSSVLFDTGKSEIRAEGKALLDRFVPVYLNVLLRDEYSAYLGEIIIEGYTDSTGDYYNNLKLSQERALSVATYILKMPGLTTRQRDLLKSGLLTITGRGATGLIHDQYGNEDKEASRRVEFHFSLKDSEMIDQMNRLLQQTEGD